MRERFLSQHWQAFPAMPEGFKLRGRIRSLTKGEEIVLEGERIPFDGNWTLGPAISNAKGLELFEILRVGDIVAFKAGEFFLLAPQQKEFSRGIRTPSQNLLLEFSKFQTELRKFFVDLGFLETLTPSLVPCPGTEVYVDAFSTELKTAGKSQRVFLPTSPELHLKKSLAMGYGPIFEIKNCFRNNEVSESHQPEFLMLEWYRPYENLGSIATDCENLLRLLSKNPQLQLRQISMRDLFLETLKFDLKPETSQTDLYNLATHLNLRVSTKDSIDDLFNLIFVEKIEGQIDKEIPLLVKNFPPFQAAYSRLTIEGWADRFEIYWQGLELSNAFHEVNDPSLQKTRMLADLQKKKDLGRSTLPLDEEFFLALESGMPPCAGIALGVERLFMAIHKLKSIQELRIFPTSTR